MQISTDDLDAFLTIHREGSFAAAAEKLMVSSPALTRRIKKLETIVGDQVFDRAGHKITLTPTGRALIGEAERLALHHESFSRFAESVAREFDVEVNFASIMGVASAIIPKIIFDHETEHPKAHFHVLDCNGVDALKLVINGMVEFAISTRPPETLGLTFDALCSDPLVLVVPQGHHLYDRSSIRWDDLNDHRITMAAGASSTMELVENALAESEIGMPKGLEVIQLSTAIGFVQRGGYAAVLPKLSAMLAGSSNVRRIPLTAPEIVREIGIIHQPGRQFGLATLAFLERLRSDFAQEYESRVDGDRSPFVIDI